MSDEKPKPFAEVRYNAENYEHEVVVGGEVVATDGDGDGWEDETGNAMLVDRRRWCANINAAVEARDAKLRGVLERFIRYGVRPDYDGRSLCEFCERRLETDPVFHADHLAGCGGASLVEEARAALGPNPPAYVPKSQLDEANETIAQIQAAFQVLDAREDMTAETVRAYLEANNLKRPPCIPFHVRQDAVKACSDNDIRAEALRQAIPVGIESENGRYWQIRIGGNAVASIERGVPVTQSRPTAETQVELRERFGHCAASIGAAWCDRPHNHEGPHRSTGRLGSSGVEWT